MRITSKRDRKAFMELLRAHTPAEQIARGFNMRLTTVHRWIRKLTTNQPINKKGKHHEHSHQ